jgi:polyhydroxybutyrate depolymerase
VAPRSSLPLLVSLHGLGANGSIQSAVTHWPTFDDARAAAGSPLLLAFPDGVSTLWFWGLDSSYDVAFLFDLVAGLEATGCVDRSRVFVDGWSEGAYMAQRMACAAGDPAVDRRGVVLAAVHSYAGGDPAVVPGSCRPGPGPSVLLSQGLDDGLVDPRRTGFPAFRAWGSRLACGPASAPCTAAQHLSGCLGGAAVAWWPVNGFGHLTWSCSADELWHDRGVWAFLTTRSTPAAATCP